MRLKKKLPNILKTINNVLGQEKIIQQEVLLNIVNKNFVSNQRITTRQLICALKGYDYKNRNGVLEFRK